MNIYIKLLCIPLFMSATAIHAGPASVTNNYIYCGTEGSSYVSCAGIVAGGGKLNAVGELYYFNPIDEKVPIQDLGSINENKTITINLPSVGQKKILSLIPTQGALATKKSTSAKKVRILIATYSLKDTPPRNMAKEFDMAHKENPQASIMVKIYRQIGEGTRWMEMISSIFSPIIPVEKIPVSVQITPQGSATITEFDNEGNEKPTVFNLTEVY